MSTENLNRFMDTARNDPALAKKIGEARDPGALLKLAAERGLPFTGEEFASLRRPSGGDELSDDQLDKVAGGLDINPENAQIVYEKMRSLADEFLLTIASQSPSQRVAR